MNDIQSWGQSSMQIAQSDSQILDNSFNGFMNQSALQSQGQANLVQGTIYGGADYYNGNGQAFSLPIYPDPNMAYSTPDGNPLAFDYATNTWYIGDAYGWWSPLQQY